MGRCKIIVNIPSVEAMRAMTVGHYDDDELETYIQAVICKIENAAKEGLFFTRIEYKEIVDNPIYYDNYYDSYRRLNKYGNSLFDYIISCFTNEGYNCWSNQYPNNSGFTVAWYPNKESS